MLTISCVELDTSVGCQYLSSRHGERKLGRVKIHVQGWDVHPLKEKGDISGGKRRRLSSQHKVSVHRFPYKVIRRGTGRREAAAWEDSFLSRNKQRKRLESPSVTHRSCESKG